MRSPLLTSSHCSGRFPWQPLAYFPSLDLHTLNIPSEWCHKHLIFVSNFFQAVQCFEESHAVRVSVIVTFAWNMVSTEHIFFIHSSVCEHAWCFYFCLFCFWVFTYNCLNTGRYKSLPSWCRDLEVKLETLSLCTPLHSLQQHFHSSTCLLTLAISSSDTEKAFVKTQDPFMIKALRKMGTKGIINIIKALYDKLTSKVILKGERLYSDSLQHLIAIKYKYLAILISQWVAVI